MFRRGPYPALPGDAVVLVTGAARGLGLVLARLLRRETAFRLALTARADSLPRLAEAGFAPDERTLLLPLDVARCGEGRAAVAAVEARWGRVDAVVNNAGIALRSVVEHLDAPDLDEVMAVNFRGPAEIIQAALPGMRARRLGRVVTVSSVGGMMAMPTMAAYSASKFAVEGLCESLWYEVRPWGVAVSLVEPGFINSDGFTRTRYTAASCEAERAAHADYHAHYEAMGGMIARLMRGTRATPEHVAAVILRTLRAPSPRLRVRATPDALVFDYLRRWLPRRLYHWVLYRSLPGVRRWGPAPRLNDSAKRR